MGKRQVKETLNRIRKLCSRCDFHYEFPPKLFGVEQAILLRRLELPPKDDFALCFTLSEALKYLESFYDDVREQQKAVRKGDKVFRYQVIEACTKLGMRCVFNKRTRLNPPSFKIYNPDEYQEALGPSLSVNAVRSLLQIKHCGIYGIIPPVKEIKIDQEKS